MTRDSYGLIVTTEGDGGDSARYMWCFGLANHLREKHQLKVYYEVNHPQANIMLLEPAPGVVIRHPNPLKWWSHIDETSRDQTLGAFVYAQIHDREFLTRLVKAHRARWWFCSNKKDQLWFQSSVINRALGGWWRTALLYITDWFFLFDFFVNIGWLPKYNDGKKKWIWFDPDDTGPLWNAVIALCQPGYETFVRRFIRWLYGSYLPENLGTVAYKEWHSLAAGLMWECRLSAKGNPDLAEMWRVLVYEYFPRWKVHRW